MDNPYPTNEGFSKRDLAYLLYKRRKQILAVFAASLLLTTASAYIKSRTYEAYASIYVERGEPAVATGTQSVPRIVLDRKEILNSEIDFMLSRAVIGKAADELLKPNPSTRRKQRPPPPVLLVALKATLTWLKATLIGVGLIDDVGSREGLIDALQGNLEAEPALNSNIITITYEDDSAQNAARIVNTITKIYLEERLRLVKRPARYDFYKEQVEISRAHALELEQQVRSLKSSSDVVAGDEEIRLKLEELRDLDAELKQTQAQREEFEQRLELLKAQLSEMPETITSTTTRGRNPELLGLTTNLAALQENRARDIQVYRPESQRIKNLDRSIEVLESQIAKLDQTVNVSETVIANEMRREHQKLLREAEVEYHTAVTREEILRGQIGGLREDLQRIDGHTAQMNNLTTALKNAENTYMRYAELQEDARISDATEVSMTNVDVIHYAAVPERPKRPRIIDIIIGATLGLFMGIGIAFAAEFFDHSLENKEDVERTLDLPLLASLPEVDDTSGSVARALLRLFGRGRYAGGRQ